MSKKTTATIIALAGVSVVLAGGYILWKRRDSVKSFLKKQVSGEMWFNKKLNWWQEETWGKKSKAEVERLHPKFRNTIREFFDDVEKKTGGQMIVTSGYRDFAKQAQLYLENSHNAQAGKSHHNYGFAVDVNVINPKTGAIVLRKATPKDVWEKSTIPEIAKKHGLLWGGEEFSTYYDPVHFFIRPKGLSVTDLLAKHQAGDVDKEGYVKV